MTKKWDMQKPDGHKALYTEENADLNTSHTSTHPPAAFNHQVGTYTQQVATTTTLAPNQKRLDHLHKGDGKGKSVIERDYHFDTTGKKVDAKKFPGLVRYTVSAWSVQEAQSIVNSLRAGASIEDTNSPNSDKQRVTHDLVNVTNASDKRAFDTPEEMLAELKIERRSRMKAIVIERMVAFRAKQAARRALEEQPDDDKT